MTSINDQSQMSNGSGATVACIEAQDVIFAEPLREYLERNGCRVVVNSKTEESLLYVICVGESDFVKSFYEDRPAERAKKLAIIYGDDDNNLSRLRSSGVKLYYTDPRPLTDGQTKKIFAFFFTAKEEQRDDRKDPKTVSHRSVITKEPSREPSESDGKQALIDTNRIAQMMRQIFIHGESETKRKQKGRWWKSAMRWIAGAVLSFLLPIMLYGISIGLSAGFLATSSKALLAGNIPWTETLLRFSRTHIQNSQIILNLLSPLADMVGLGGYAQDQDRLLSVLSDATLAESGVIAIFGTSKDVGRAVFFPKDTETDVGISDVTKLTSEVSRVSQHLALVQAELDSLLASRRFPFNTTGIAGLGSRGLAALYGVRTLIGYTEKLLTLYPQMGGFRRKQTYLVLLQNSMELRPTGGFIGSMLLVSFVDGKVDDMHVLDVYDADGQLKGHVDPPQPIREIMGQVHWYLRDSNWDPDFSISGQQSAWFYEKEMGQSVDGVIAVSLPFVTNLLHVLGPVEVSDFNERISESNFFAKSLLYTQTDFFPGSKQKKDFLGALTSALLLRITGDKNVSAGQLLRSIADSIQARDVQFYFGDSTLEQLVSQWGWDGGVRIGQCQSIVRESTCIGDGVGIAEANLGINKVNYFVTHEALSDISIKDDGSIIQTLTVKIRNTMPSQMLNGAGAYQTYFRVYYPKDTVVLSMKLDGVDVPIRTDASGSSMVVSVPFAVAPRQEHQLMIETSRTVPTLIDSGSYQFTIRKQAGVSLYPWHVIIHYPAPWTAYPESGIAKPGMLEYNTDLTRDANLRVIFRK